MGPMREVGPMSIVSTLMKSGLNEDQINRALRHMAGHDWRSVRTAELLRRLRQKGLIIHPDEGFFLFDLEALIKSWIKSHELGRLGWRQDSILSYAKMRTRRSGEDRSGG